MVSTSSSAYFVPFRLDVSLGSLADETRAEGTNNHAERTPTGGSYGLAPPAGRVPYGQEREAGKPYLTSARTPQAGVRNNFHTDDGIFTFRNY